MHHAQSACNSRNHRGLCVRREIHHVSRRMVRLHLTDWNVTVNHMEFAQAESDSLKATAWEKWCTELETLMGHSMDGDSEADGYSMDEAYEMWESGHTIYATSYAFRSRGQYISPDSVYADDYWGPYN